MWANVKWLEAELSYTKSQLDYTKAVRDQVMAREAWANSQMEA